MSSSLNPIRRLLSNGAKIEKCLHPVKLLLVLFNGVKKIKESYRGPFSYLGKTPYINFQRLRPVYQLLTPTVFCAKHIRSCITGLRRFYSENTGSCITGIISFILFISLSFISFSGPLPAKETSSFLRCLPETLSESCSQDLFLNPANRLLIESPDFLLVEKSSLRAATPPALVSPQILGTLIGEYGPEEAKKVIKEYIVESGDTLSSLAAEFEVSLNTILWANDLTEKSTLKIGQKLVIPPVSGVIHYVKSGDTVSEVARIYKGKVDKIVAFNDLSDENDIYIGDILFVPNGVMPSVSARPIITQAPVSSAYFIPPTKGVISQGLHWYNAVDFANSCGALVFAAAQGVVQRVSYGWNDGYGSYLTILHPNGIVTLYAHLSEILVSSGSNVSQGSIIGRVGNTGRTKGPTGCHVHFEVRGGQNPFAR